MHWMSVCAETLPTSGSGVGYAHDPPHRWCVGLGPRCMLCGLLLRARRDLLLVSYSFCLRYLLLQYGALMMTLIVGLFEDNPSKSGRIFSVQGYVWPFIYFYDSRLIHGITNPGEKVHAAGFLSSCACCVCVCSVLCCAVLCCAVL